MILKQGAKKIVVGIALGLIAALTLTSKVSEHLFQVTPTEPSTFIGVTVFVLGISLLASYLPARKALRIDPMQALRVE